MDKLNCLLRIAFLCLLAPTASGQPREVAVTYLSWFQPFGKMVGCDKWNSGGPGYLRQNITGQNRPLRAQLSSLNQTISPVTFGLSELGKMYLRSELTAIRDAGFDVVAYDMLPDPAPNRPTLNAAGYCALDLFAAYGELAGELSLKLALFSDIKNLSADHPNGYVFSQEEWLSAYSKVLSKYGSSSWYWNIQGRPAIFQFGATVGAMKGSTGKEAISRWAEIGRMLKRDNREFELFLDIRPADIDAIKPTVWQNGIQPFIFAPGAPFRFLNNFTKTLIDRNGGKTWTVSPNYYNKRLNVYLPPDFSRIHETYQSAIDSGARFMLVNTWNDFDEDTDIVPSTSKGPAIARVFSYYNNWFKSGTKPAISSNITVVNLPRARQRAVISGPPSWGNGAEESEKSDFGKITYYWANMKEDGWLKIGDVYKPLRAGISYGKVNIGDAFRVKVSTSYNVSAEAMIVDETNISESESVTGRKYQSLLLED